MLEDVHAPGSQAPAARYRDPDRDGLIAMCANCRRARRPDAPTEWDWVPALVADPQGEVTHSICPPCVELYYPGE